MSLDVYLHADGDELYSCNITHNVSRMWDVLGIYEHLYNKDNHIKTAGEFASFAKDAVWQMAAAPQAFQTFNSPNGWGKYEHALEFLMKLTVACLQNPDAEYITSY